MTREDFIAAHPIERELTERGVAVLGNGIKKMAKCPFHEDKQASFSVDTNKGLWNCFAGCGGGSVIDLIAKFDGKSISDVLRNGELPRVAPQRPTIIRTSAPKQELVEEKTYSYLNAIGAEVYQVIRYRPKTFRQRRLGALGQWVWNMEGVERVLYRLPEVLKSNIVAIAEGEKDADTLTRLGLCGTTHVAGSKNWLDSYSEPLVGKELYIFNDNDGPGEEWRQKVFDATAGKCASVRLVKIPKTFKDVTEYADSFGDDEKAKRAITQIVADTHPFIQGTKLPIYTMGEMEERYSRYARSIEDSSLDLSRWLPTLGRVSRRLVPGEVVLLLADTGGGKTAMLSSIAIAANPLPTLMFELELPGELLFERLVAARTKFNCRDVETNYSTGETLGIPEMNRLFPHLFISWEPRVTVEQLESLIFRSELKIGQPPKIVLLDYVQLVQGKGGSRYEKISSVAEELKVMAKATRTIVIVASQVSRPSSDDPEITLHDAKDSGSLENSAGLVLGAWRDEQDKTLLHLKILKQTKGFSGTEIHCNFFGEKMLINERSQFAEPRERNSD